MSSPQELEHIALEYHLNKTQPDMMIERVCQQVELDWIQTKIQQDDHVLEMGYGDGVTFARLAPLSPYTLVEGSESLVRVAEKTPEAASDTVAICHSLFEDFMPDPLADLVIASHVLEHVSDPVGILHRIHSWLAPDGRVLVVVPNADSIHRRVAVEMGIQSRRDDLSARDVIVGHQRVYTLKRLLADLAAGGFVAEEVRGFFIKPVSNAQMLSWDEGLVRALCLIGTQLPPEYCANIAVLCSVQSK